MSTPKYKRKKILPGEKDSVENIKNDNVDDIVVTSSSEIDPNNVRSSKTVELNNPLGTPPVDITPVNIMRVDAIRVDTLSTPDQSKESSQTFKQLEHSSSYTLVPRAPIKNLRLSGYHAPQIIEQVQPYNNETQVSIIIGKHGEITKILKTPPFENLALKGAGMRGIAYLGAVKPLYDREIIKNLKNVIGTSAGSIVAGLIGIGLSYEDILEASKEVDFKKIVTTVPPILEVSLITERIKNQIVADWTKQTPIEAAKASNLDDGEKLLDIIRGIIKTRIEAIIKNYPDKFIDFKIEDYNKITFADLSEIARRCPAANIKDLTITGTRIEKKLKDGKDVIEGEIEYFNVKNSANMEVALAIRISSSIPYFFKPVEYKGNLYIDGGCADNFPIAKYDGLPASTPGVIKNTGVLGQNLSTLGIRIDTKKEIQNVMFNRSFVLDEQETLLYYIKDFIRSNITHSETTEADKNMDSDSHHKYAHTTVQIDDQGAGMAEFNMPEKKQKKLVSGSEDKMNEWLDTYNHPANLMECKKYDSFEAMCEDMECDELGAFLKLLETEMQSKKNMILCNEAEEQIPFDQYNQYIDTAKNIFKQKSREPKKISNSPFVKVCNAISTHLADMDLRNNKNVELPFQKMYLYAILEMTDSIQKLSIDDKEKARLLLIWAAPALDEKTIISLVKNNNIDTNTLNSKYVNLLYSLKRKIYSIEADILDKSKSLITINDDKIKDIINKDINILIEYKNKLELELDTAVSKIEQYTDLNDEQCAGYLLKQIKPLLDFDSNDLDIKECDLPPKKRAKANAILPANEIDAPFLFGFDNHVKRKSKNLFQKVLATKKDAQLKLFLKNKTDNLQRVLLKLIENNYDKILEERYFWSIENLMSLLNNNFTILTDEGKEHPLIASWKRTTAKQLHDAFETSMLRKTFEKKCSKLTKGLAFIPFDYEAKLPIGLKTDSLKGWKQFEEEVDKYCNGLTKNPDLPTVSITSAFINLVIDNKGTLLNIQEWSANLVRLFINKCVNKENIILSNEFKQKIDASVNALIDKLLNIVLIEKDKLVLKPSLTVTPEKHLDYYHQILLTLHDLADVDVNDKKLIEIRKHLLDNLPDRNVKEFFTLICEYNKLMRQPISVDTKKELNVVNMKLKYLLSRLPLLSDLPDEESDINTYLHAYYYTFIKQDKKGYLIYDKNYPMEEVSSIKTVVLNWTGKLEKNLFPLAYLLKEQFCKPEEKRQILKAGADLLCSQSEADLAEDYINHLKMKNGEEYEFIPGTTEQTILKGLIHALKVGNTKAIALVKANWDVFNELTITDTTLELCQYWQDVDKNSYSIDNIDNLLTDFKKIKTLDDAILKKLQKLEMVTTDSLLKKDEAEKDQTSNINKLDTFLAERIQNGRYDKSIVEDKLVKLEKEIEQIENKKNNRFLGFDEMLVKNEIIDELKKNYLNKRSSKFFNFFRDNLLTSMKTLLVNESIKIIEALPHKDVKSIKNIILRMKMLNWIIEELRDEKKLTFKKLPEKIINNVFSKFLNGKPLTEAAKNTEDTEDLAEAVDAFFNKDADEEKRLFINNVESKLEELMNRKPDNGLGKKYRPGFSSGLSKVIEKIQSVIDDPENHQPFEKKQPVTVNDVVSKKNVA